VVVVPSTTSSPPAPTAAQADEELAARLRLSATRLARRLRQEADAGLTPSQLSALAVIEREGPLTLGALAEHEKVAPPSITKVVAKLESIGLVARAVDPGDRRFVRVTLTAAGRALLEDSRRRKTAWLTGRIRELGPGEREQLAAALDVLDVLVSGQQRP
jgi:DNA-binding MarR family transcriptional regulator